MCRRQHQRLNKKASTYQWSVRSSSPEDHWPRHVLLPEVFYDRVRSSNAHLTGTSAHPRRSIHDSQTGKFQRLTTVYRRLLRRRTRCLDSSRFIQRRAQRVLMEDPRSPPTRRSSSCRAGRINWSLSARYLSQSLRPSSTTKKLSVSGWTRRGRRWAMVKSVEYATDCRTLSRTEGDNPRLPQRRLPRPLGVEAYAARPSAETTP